MRAPPPDSAWVISVTPSRAVPSAARLPSQFVNGSDSPGIDCSVSRIVHISFVYGVMFRIDGIGSSTTRPPASIGRYTLAFNTVPSLMVTGTSQSTCTPG